MRDNRTMGERPSLPVPPLRIPFENMRSRVGGYDRDVTRRVFEDIAGFYEALWLQHEALRAAEAELRAALAEREDVTEQGGALSDDESAVALREEARREAELALRKVRKKAEKEARRIEREAVTKAAEIVEQARRERREIELENQHIGTFASETREELSSFLLAALKWYKRGLDGGAPDLGPRLEAELEARSEAAEEIPERGELEARATSLPDAPAPATPSGVPGSQRPV